jgi:hypothetical protein
LVYPALLNIAPDVSTGNKLDMVAFADELDYCGDDGVLKELGYSWNTAPAGKSRSAAQEKEEA